MSEGKNKRQILTGMMWSFAERISAQLVSTLVTIILARLLDPEHYGIISIVTVIITFLNIFVTGGFDSAIIQKKDADSLDYNTAFIISISVSFFLYGILFFAAPSIASFYDMPELTPVIRVMGIRLIIAAVNNIQQAYIRKNMAFKKFFWATLLGTVISGVVGIILAYSGFGVWALVAQYLTNVSIDTVMLFVVSEWRPKLEFSVQRAKRIWSFGWKVLATTLVYTIEGDIRSLIVGKVFGPSDLAYYDQGKKYPSLLVGNVNTTINKVMLPAYSKLQDNREELLRTLRQTIMIGVFILAPLLIGFAAIAESFVSLILTDKWLPAVPFIQIFSVSYLTRPLEESCRQALLAIGKSGTVLKCMIIINIIALISVLIAVFGLHSVLAIALFSFLTTLISLIAFLYSAKRNLGYKIKYQIHDVLPPLIIGAFMAVVVYFIGKISIVLWARIIIQIVVGGIVYILGSWLFKIEAFQLTIKLLKRIRK